MSNKTQNLILSTQVFCGGGHALDKQAITYGHGGISQKFETASAPLSERQTSHNKILVGWIT
jgi:hypothetical protein